MNQADAHFAGWLMCPVCKKETRHYTKDTHENPVSKIRRICCEDCRVVQMQFKQTNKQTANRKKAKKPNNYPLFYHSNLNLTERALADGIVV
jgi:hypothetical protein